MTKSNYLIGLNLGHVDPSVTLFKGSKVLMHLEEERFTRKKKGLNQNPVNSLKYCLDMLPNGISDITAINLGFDHDMFTLEVPALYIQEWQRYPNKNSEAGDYELKRLKDKNPRNIILRIHKILEEIGISDDLFPKINWYNHHYCHALSAHLSSPFENSLSIVVDSNSELDTCSVWVADGCKLNKIYSKTLPHSLGWLYRSFTLFCGFDAYEGEGMLMGLAPYGKPNKLIAEKIEKILQWKKDDDGFFDFSVDPEYVYIGERDKSNKSITKKLIDTFGEAADSVETPSQYYKDIAYEIQDRLEKTLAKFVERFVKQTGIKKVSLSGGVFLNCKVNGFIWKESSEIEDIYIVPIASDDGIGIGANMAYGVENISKNRSDYSLPNVYLGNEYSDEEINNEIDNFSIRNNFGNIQQYASLIKSLDLPQSKEELKSLLADRNGYKLINAAVSRFLKEKIFCPEDLTVYIAKCICEGKVVGWFQGRMEAGPRALGSRSILADPRRMSSLDNINRKVKFRQPWRPFCPSVLNEDSEKYFKKVTQSPYMINTFDVTEITEKEAPAIVHVDKTARPQFLTKEANPLYYQLLYDFKKISGVPILMNTSMNIKGEPICRSPEDALNLFFATDIDVLSIGKFVFKK